MIPQLPFCRSTFGRMLLEQKFGSQCSTMAWGVVMIHYDPTTQIHSRSVEDQIRPRVITNT
jgi:hypothetical protein